MSSAITPRQAEVLQLLAAGLRVKEIARRLRINPRTVQGHLAAIRRSLGVASNPHLVAIAVGRGLLPHPGAQAVRGGEFVMSLDFRPAALCTRRRERFSATAASR